MNTIPEFKSDLAPFMTSYCEQCLQSNSDVVKNFRMLHQLDDYCHEEGHCLGILDSNLVAGFLQSCLPQLKIKKKPVTCYNGTGYGLSLVS